SASRPAPWYAAARMICEKYASGSSRAAREASSTASSWRRAPDSASANIDRGRSEERRVGKSVGCCVDLGGRRIIKKKKKEERENMVRYKKYGGRMKRRKEK